VVSLGDIDVEGLCEPFEGAFPAGKSLRFDPVFDEVKRARVSESDYLPQGIWERDTKQANWTLSRDKSFEVLNTKSKDLQFAAWLTEALSHIDGIEGTIKGFSLIEKLTNKLWNEIFPSIDDDDDFTARLLILEWLDRSLPAAFDMINVTATDTDLVGNLSLREWQDLKRNPESEKIKHEDLWAAITRTPGEYFVMLGSQVNQLQEILDQTTKAYANICGPGSVRFPKINSSIGSIKNCLLEVERYQAEHLATENNNLKSLETTKVTKVVGSSDINSKNKNLPSKGPFDLLVECGNVVDRDQAYKALEILAERLVVLDPHSAAPYLAKKAASFKDLSFAELMLEMIDDERMRKHLFKLMGINDE
jgi:type VI secretion system protein ImpA